MTEDPSPYLILVGIDYSTASEFALERALELATAEASAELHVVHVIPAVELPVQDAAAKSDTANAGSFDQKAYLELTSHIDISVGAFAKKHQKNAAPLRVVGHLRYHAPAREIAQLAADLQADMVVVGMHGRGAFSRFFLGSVAQAVTRLAPCPVLVFRPKGLTPEYPRIEPPCPRCIEARVASDGEQFWCEQHRERHGQRHVYFQSDRISNDGSLPLVCSSTTSDA